MSAKARTLAVVLLLTLFPSISNAELKDNTNQADYLVIYHQDFETEIQDFIAWRGSKGLKVLAVDIDSIYAEFESSGPQEQVREFISYTLEYWDKPAPKYVLLVGSVNHVPSYKIESQFAGNPNLNEDSVSIDGVFAYNLHEDDTKPDVALGRFPARSTRDLRNMIDKTIYFEDQFEEIEYENDLLVLLDKQDFETFDKASDRVADNLLSNLRKVKLTNKSDEPGYATKEQIFDAMNNGTVFIYNFFHGAPKIWFRDAYIVYDDIATRQFSKKPFILIGVSCSQNFDSLNGYNIIDRLMAKENGGPVAAIASSGINYLSMSTDLIYSFFSYSIENHSASTGTALKEALRDRLDNYSRKDEFTRRISLLGDPALKMPMDYIMSIKNNPEITEERITISPNPVSDKALISIDLKKEDYVSISIFDLQGIPVLHEGSFYASGGQLLYNLVPRNLSEGMYVCRIRIGNESYYQKIVIAK